jgi:predicted lipid carrier protein YhbT
MQFPTLPRWLANVNQRLPQWPNAMLMAFLLNIGKKLHVMPDAEELEGRTIAVFAKDLGITCCVRVINGKFKPVWKKTVADVTISAATEDFIRLMRREEDPDTLFFNRKLMIDGDTELGLTVKNLLDSIDWSNFSWTQWAKA